LRKQIILKQFLFFFGVIENLIQTFEKVFSGTILSKALKIGLISFDLSSLEKGFCYRFERIRLALDSRDDA